MHVRLSQLVALTIGFSAAISAVTWAAEPEAALDVVKELAQVNGQALACQDGGTATKAKQLMLAHAPKTPRYGALFEENTNASYLEQVRGTAACPDAEMVTKRLAILAKRLEEVLPTSAIK